MKKIYKTGIALLLLILFTDSILNAVPRNEIISNNFTGFHLDSLRKATNKKIKPKSVNNSGYRRVPVYLVSGKDWNKMVEPWLKDFNYWKTLRRTLK